MKGEITTIYSANELIVKDCQAVHSRIVLPCVNKKAFLVILYVVLF